jgi:hypothetical protein
VPILMNSSEVPTSICSVAALSRLAEHPANRAVSEQLSSPSRAEPEYTIAKELASWSPPLEKPSKSFSQSAWRTHKNEHTTVCRRKASRSEKVPIVRHKEKVAFPGVNLRIASVPSEPLLPLCFTDLSKSGKPNKFCGNTRLNVVVEQNERRLSSLPDFSPRHSPRPSASDPLAERGRSHSCPCHGYDRRVRG